MELTDLTTKHKNKIINSTIIILALIISSNIYKKQNHEMELLKKKQDIEIKKNEIIKNISQFTIRIKSYKNLLTKKDISSIITNISEMAKQSGIKIVSIRPESEQEFPNYIKFPFILALSAADYNAIGKFIGKVESYQDVYIVEALNIRPSEVLTMELTVNLKLSSVAFVD